MEALIPDLVISLRTLGLELRIEAGKLIARPSRLVTADIRHIIELHRDELIACLEQKDPTAGHSAVDTGIRRFEGVTHSRDRILRSLERSLIQYSRTPDPLWAEVAAIWAQALFFHDAVYQVAEETESTGEVAA